MKGKKNSDSDYKAQDQGNFFRNQGSATDGQNKKKTIKKNQNLFPKMNKKQIIQQAINSFLPEGVTLTKDHNLTFDKYEELKLIDDAPQFSLNYKIFLAKIVKVVDGDTVKAVILLNNTFTRFTFRLNGIDTPESRKGDVKQFGKKVKEIMTTMLIGKMVKIEAGDFDKYGRILARIYVYEQKGKERKQFCINDFLIENDLAKSYHGKTKVEFSQGDYEDFEEKYEQKEWPKVVDYPFLA